MVKIRRLVLKESETRMRFVASLLLTCCHVPAVPAVTALLAAFLWLALGPATAEPTASLNLELSKIKDSPQGCLATLSIGNGLGQTLDRFRLDLILFDGGNVPFDRLMIDLAPLPANRTTIAAFPLHGGLCAKISRIQLRDVPACRAQGGGAPDCLAGLVITTPTAIGFSR